MIWQNIKLSIKSILVASMILLIIGCATTAKYRAILDQWHEQSIDDFVHMWGYPNNTLKLEDNKTAYVYSDKQIVSTPLNQMPTNITTVQNGNNTTIISTPGAIIGGQTYSLSCTTWIVFDNKTKKIVNTTFRGNNCIAY
ncbi:hypothetical protein [Fastidiosibacter lacustris]|uniref:hypothetical protein n=1 Tax=Fastidiosibacter lacustris TaxID=2056695 RepID=UPI000E34F1B0|nr:hypothetical protein [Fastidiosibacter lacustris]